MASTLCKSSSTSFSVVGYLREFTSHLKVDIPIVILLGICTLPSILFYGGFYNAPSCLGGVVAAIACIVLAIVRRKIPGVPYVSLGFFIIAIAYLVSTICNGFNLTTLSETGVWFFAALVSLLCSFYRLKSYEGLINLIAILGIISCFIGFLIYTEVISSTGFINEGRLQFPFTYANTAGIWYVVVFVICFISKIRLLELFSPLPIAALCFTQSGGAFLVFAVTAAVGFVIYLKQKQYGKILQGFFYIALGIFIFLLSKDLVGAAALVALVLSILTCFIVELARVKLPFSVKQKLASKWIVWIVFAFTLIGVIVLAFVFSERVSGAWVHFAERLVHIYDAFALYASSPIFGIGPDMWQYEYGLVQTAQYHTTIVHSSFMQILLDAGPVALICLVGILCISLRSMYKMRDWRAFIVICIIAGHSLIDFDLQFGSMLALVATIATVPYGRSLFVKSTGISLTIRLLIGIFSLLVCLIGFSNSMTSMSIKQNNQVENNEYVIYEFESHPYAWADSGAQDSYLESLNNTQQYEKTIAWHSHFDITTERQALAVAWAYCELGQIEKGESVLIEEFEKRPYNASLILASGELFDTFGVPEGLKTRLNAAVENANQCALSQWRPLLDNAIFIEACY